MFTNFGLSHIVVLVILHVGILALFGLANYCAKKPNQKNIIAKYLQTFLITLLVLHLVYYNGRHLLLGTFKTYWHLPLHLCSSASYICIIALVTKNKFMQQMAYLWALVGAWGAAILPDLQTPDFPGFNFIEFFTSHIAIVWSVFYILLFEKMKLKYINIWRVFAVLLIFAVFSYAANSVFGANYLYLTEKAGNQGPFLLMLDGFLYIPSMAFLVLVIYHLQYLAVNFKSLLK